MRSLLLLPLFASVVFACSGGTGPAPNTDGGDGTQTPAPTPEAGASETGTTTDAATDAPPRLCTPGASVFCRCEDAAASTKLCRADGQSFDPCKCN